MIRQASLASGSPDGLGDERDGARRARVGLDHVQPAGVDRVLDVDQPDDADPKRDVARRGADLLEHLLAERVRRQHAGAVAGVDAGLLDVLHDAADPHLGAVAEGVDVDLDRVLEEPVEEDLPPFPGLAAQVVGQALVRVDDLHRPATEDVGGRTSSGKPTSPAQSERLLDRAGGGVRRGLDVQPVEQRAEAAAILGEVDRVDARAQQRHAASSSPAASFSGVWPPNWTITPSAASRSTSTTARTSSSVSGSKYRRSEVSKSVETVSGLELTITASRPDSRTVIAACTQQ